MATKFSLDDTFKRFSIQSTMTKPIYNRGPIGTTISPCVVYGLYNESTGSVLLETVICDGQPWDLLQLDADDLNKFYVLLEIEIADKFF